MNYHYCSVELFTSALLVLRKSVGWLGFGLSNVPSTTKGQSSFSFLLPDKKRVVEHQMNNALQLGSNALQLDVFPSA